MTADAATSALESNLESIDAETPFESVLLGPTFLDEPLKEHPVTRFLVLRGLVGTFDITSAANEPSPEYEQSREARRLLAGSLAQTGDAELEITPDDRGGWRFTPDLLHVDDKDVKVDYDCMNSVASRLRNLLSPEHRSLKPWEITAMLVGNPARERGLFGGHYDELCRYVERTHTIGNFSLIPYTRNGPSKGYNHEKGRTYEDREDKFLQRLHNEWDSDELTWETAEGSSCPCRDVMSFERYVKVAQLELYCVPDEVVHAFLATTEGEKDDRAVVAAYESIVVKSYGAPVDFGEGDLSYLRGATARILARERLVMARLRLAQATMTVARKPTA